MSPFFGTVGAFFFSLNLSDIAPLPMVSSMKFSSSQQRSFNALERERLEEDPSKLSFSSMPRYTVLYVLSPKPYLVKWISARIHHHHHRQFLPSLSPTQTFSSFTCSGSRIARPGVNPFHSKNADQQNRKQYYSPPRPHELHNIANRDLDLHSLPQPLSITLSTFGTNLNPE